MSSVSPSEGAAGEMTVRVEVWSDVVCPWCYIGKRRLEKALARFEHAGQVEVVWRAFQLDPSHPGGVRKPVHAYLAERMAATAAQVRAMHEQVTALAADEGLAYDFGPAVMVNTIDAHRLTHLAAAHGLGTEMHERLLRGHLMEGEVLDDVATLVRLAEETGVPADEARRVLDGEAYAREVEEDFAQARALGAGGVPFFVLNRAYGLSGAQPVDTFLSALRTAYDASAERIASR